MTNEAPSYLNADPSVLNLHTEIDDYCLAINDTISLKETEYPLGSGALHSIFADAIAIHRAILSLCFDGWAFAAPSLLRMQLDLILSAAVIVKDEKQRDYMGFKYMFFFSRESYQDGTMSSESRKQFDKAFSILEASLADKGREFLDSANRQAYWYRPEYNSPINIIKKLMSPEIEIAYKRFSGATHGGFFGLRYLKDRPNDIHPNPRRDTRSQNHALLLSSRFMLEMSNVRAWMESLPRNDKRETLLSQIRALNGTLPACSSWE